MISQRAILQRLPGHADAAPQQRSNARFQLIEFKGFGEVIISPQIQPLDPIGNVGSGGQQQHRQVLAALAQTGQQIQPIQARQRHVQHHQRIAFV
ncbi:hypothetical protein D3C79_877270 [compost metagenome]